MNWLSDIIAEEDAKVLTWLEDSVADAELSDYLDQVIANVQENGKNPDNLLN